ncbi:Uncharacterised protein [Vibrio cholerae]|nr:Uncharacterised protein [Vibrio cholerae]
MCECWDVMVVVQLKRSPVVLTGWLKTRPALLLPI